MKHPNLIQGQSVTLQHIDLSVEIKDKVDRLKVLRHNLTSVMQLNKIATVTPVARTCGVLLGGSR